MNRRILPLSALATILQAATTLASPIDLPINTGLSNVNVQMCILTGCDSDPSSVSGFVSAKASPLSAPTSLTLYDFTFTLNDQIDLFISFGFLGNFTGTGQNLVLFDAQPGVAQPPTPVSSGTFSYAGVPTDGTGTFTYTSTGIVCSALTNAGRPCNDVINLADQGTQSGTLNGSVSFSPGRVLTLNINPNLSIPLDPTNPGLGTLTVTGTIVATATVPLRGDVNLDGLVDGRDAQEFVTVMLNPGTASWQKRFAADMNDDDAFGDLDIIAFSSCTLSAGCPD
ncbi:MAG: dockerin type I domain-containing protein [Planctomycetota bacterium]